MKRTLLLFILILTIVSTAQALKETSTGLGSIFEIECFQDGNVAPTGEKCAIGGYNSGVIGLMYPNLTIYNVSLDGFTNGANSPSLDVAYGEYYIGFSANTIGTGVYGIINLSDGMMAHYNRSNSQYFGLESYSFNMLSGDNFNGDSIDHFNFSTASYSDAWSWSNGTIVYWEDIDCWDKQPEMNYTGLLNCFAVGTGGGGYWLRLTASGEPRVLYNDTYGGTEFVECIPSGICYGDSQNNHSLIIKAFYNDSVENISIGYSKGDMNDICCNESGECLIVWANGLARLHANDTITNITTPVNDTLISCEFENDDFVLVGGSNGYLLTGSAGNFTQPDGENGESETNETVFTNQLNMTCHFNANPYLKMNVPLLERKRIEWLCSGDYISDCISYIEKDGDILQTNPVINPVKDYGNIVSFTPRGNQTRFARVYFINRDLYAGESYSFRVECNIDNSPDIAFYEANVTPSYKPLDQPVNYAAWYADGKAGYVAAMLITSLLIISIIIYIVRKMKGK